MIRSADDLKAADSFSERSKIDRFLTLYLMARSGKGSPKLSVSPN